MTTPRKIWRTRLGYVGAEPRRHESKAKAYRYVRNDIANAQCGALRSNTLYVEVDERDGHGFQLYEKIDLLTWGWGEEK